MSSAALAKKRRANMAPTPTSPTPDSSQTNRPQAKGNITLPQVLSMMERRILQLESNIKNGNTASSSNMAIDDRSMIEKDEGLKSVLDEYEARFEMLATQFNEMKDLVLKLQSYTLEVNKMLLEKSNILEEQSVLLSNTYLDGMPINISELNINTIPETETENPEEEADIESQQPTFSDV